MKTNEKNKPDFFLLSIIVILVLGGFFFLTILSIPFSLDYFETANHFSFHQLTRGILPGIFLGFLFFLMPLYYLKRITPIFFFFSIFLTILVFFPGIGVHSGGASRWISFFGVTFQPSELLKLTTILYLALWFDKKNDFSLKRKKMRRGFLGRLKKSIGYSFKNLLLPFFIITGMIALILIIQPDISTLGIIITISLLIYFLAGTPIWHNLLIFLGGVGGIFGLTLIRIPAFSYRYSRFQVLFNPELDPLGVGFQIRQSLIAIGSGGIRGRGLGMSSQKFGFLPHPMSDSIFSVIAEEIGFLGCFILISLFVAFLWRSIEIAKSTNNKFLKLTSVGISSWIVLQSFVHIASLTGILPLTGIPLPFVSFGGSHIMVELMAMGILLNISKNV